MRPLLKQFLIKPVIKKQKYKYIKDPLTLFQSLPERDKEEGPSLYFDLLSLNMNINSMRAYTFLNIYGQLMKTIQSISTSEK